MSKSDVHGPRLHYPGMWKGMVHTISARQVCYAEAAGYALRDDMLARQQVDVSPRDLQATDQATRATPSLGDNAMNERPLLTIAEVAALLRCSKAHVSKLVNGHVPGTARLTAIHLGRRVLIRRETLDEWLLLLDKQPTFR
jgi:excisionase family DNA binding protein